MRKSTLYTYSSAKSRLTRQRQLILDILKKDFSHPSAEDIYAKVRQKLPKISLATVYRNLNFLVNMGLAREIVIPGGANRFDGHMKDHDHFVCNVCKKIYNVPKYPLEKSYLPNKDYQIGNFKLDLFGVCAACKDKAPCTLAYSQKNVKIKTI